MTEGSNNFADELREIKGIAQLAAKYKLLKPHEERELVVEYDTAKTLIPLIQEAKLDQKDKYYSDLLQHLVKRQNVILTEVVNKNLRLVINIAKSPCYVGNGIALIDLIFYGIEGLIYGFKVKFDPKRECKLSTYLTPWIRQRIGRAIENRSRLVRLPGHVLAIISKLKGLYKNYKAKHGIAPSSETLSILFKKVYNLDISSERIEELGRMQYAHISLDDSSLTSDDNGVSMIDYLSDESDNQPEMQTENAINKEYVNSLLDRLEPQERLLMTLLFGLLDYRERSIKECAQTLNLTIKEAQATHQSALIKLKTIAQREKANLD